MRKSEFKRGLQNVCDANMGFWTRKYKGFFIPVVRLSNQKTIKFPHCKNKKEAVDVAMEHAFLIAEREVSK